MVHSAQGGLLIIVSVAAFEATQPPSVRSQPGPYQLGYLKTPIRKTG
jgi:hypothetical protein